MQTEILLNEIEFKASRSSGAGGQHVNKVSSRVTLNFNIPKSEGLTETEKERLQQKLSPRLTKEGTLMVSADESRSQHKNKAIAIDRFLEILKAGLKVPKKRKKTKPSKGAVEKRLEAKKNRALKKKHRKPPEI